jgi:hypothetical protein
MTINRKILDSYLFILILLVGSVQVQAQDDTVHYSGITQSNVDYHHGQLSPAIGVHNIQVFRANREHPDWAGDAGWTYNHAPMLAYWNHKFYLEYLSCPIGEHLPPGQTLLMESMDGYHWSKPTVLFPPYKIPDGTTKQGRKEVAKDLYAVMHQRIGFFTSSAKQLLGLGYYGLVMGAHDDPNDGNGIGRVVREIKKDGSYGPIYFIRYNHAFNEKNTAYPFYTSSNDKAFIAACNELLASPLMMQQWVEEADKNDPLIPLKKDFKAFSYYHLNDGRVVGLWKYALTSISKDQGKTWAYSPMRAPGFVNANAKIWGQKTSDGKYATVYNPSEFRWPLAVSVSENGLDYTNLLLVNGEISALRYGGAYKSYGPQYVRGIQEKDGNPPGGNLWVSYSMNKEDIWVSEIPVPIKSKEDNNVDDDFAKLPEKTALQSYNIYSPIWASVVMAKLNDTTKGVLLKDADPFDYAKLERVIPNAKKGQIEFSLLPLQDQFGLLDIELVDAKGNPCIRLFLDSVGSINVKAGYRNKSVGKYRAGEKINLSLEFDVTTRFYKMNINGKQIGNNLFFAPVSSVERVVFRTGNTRRFPDADTPTDQDYDLANPGEKTKEAAYLIKTFKATKIQ